MGGGLKVFAFPVIKSCHQTAVFLTLDSETIVLEHISY